MSKKIYDLATSLVMAKALQDDVDLEGDTEAAFKWLGEKYPADLANYVKKQCERGRLPKYLKAGRAILAGERVFPHFQINRPCWECDWDRRPGLLRRQPGIQM